MAIIRAAQSGNWNSTSTWVGGVVPTSVDDVVSNSFTIQVNGVFTVLSVRNDTTGGATAGGTFVLNNSSDLTCTSTQGIFVGAASTPVVQFAGGAGTEATLRATLPATLPNIVSYVGIVHSGTGRLNIIGDISFNAGLSTRTYVSSTSTGTLNIVGNISTTTGGGSASNQCILMSGGFLFINGNVSGGGTTAGQMILGGTSVIEITGNVIASNVAHIAQGSSITIIGSITNTGTGIAINTGAAAVSVTGTITCSNTGSGVVTTTGTVNVGGSITITGSGVGVSSTTGGITVGGNITASTSANGVTSTSALVRCSGLLFNTNNFQAVYAPRITIEPTTTSITFQKIGGGTQIMYIGSATSFNLPATNDVRLGTVYGQSNEFTGTMVVQTPNNVLLGTLVDNTVGTLIMTPDNLVQELGTSTRPIAVRLQNSSTVDTTGNQMASYNI
jgi:hypothetical protein